MFHCVLTHRPVHSLAFPPYGRYFAASEPIVLRLGVGVVLDAVRWGWVLGGEEGKG